MPDDLPQRERRPSGDVPDMPHEKPMDVPPSEGPPWTFSDAMAVASKNPLLRGLGSLMKVPEAPGLLGLAALAGIGGLIASKQGKGEEYATGLFSGIGQGFQQAQSRRDERERQAKQDEMERARLAVDQGLLKLREEESKSDKDFKTRQLDQEGQRIVIEAQKAQAEIEREAREMSPEIREIFRTAIGDPNPEVRARALETLKVHHERAFALASNFAKLSTDYFQLGEAQRAYVSGTLTPWMAQVFGSMVDPSQRLGEIEGAERAAAFTRWKRIASGEPDPETGVPDPIYTASITPGESGRPLNPQEAHEASLRFGTEVSFLTGDTGVANQLVLNSQSLLDISGVYRKALKELEGASTDSESAKRVAEAMLKSQIGILSEADGLRKWEAIKSAFSSKFGAEPSEFAKKR
jgi:hypothetical protein